MWSSNEAIRRHVVELGVSRTVRRRVGARQSAYELNTPGWARGWIDTLALDWEPPLHDYIAACIVVETGGDAEPNLRQRVYSRSARGIEYGRSLFYALTIIQHIRRVLYRPAVVSLGRRISAAPKQIVPPDQAVEAMLSEAKVTVSTGLVTSHVDELIRLLAACRQGEVSGTALEVVASRVASDNAHRDARAAMGFGIAHELAHHLLGHGVAARQGSDDHYPGKRLLAEWRSDIGYEDQVRRSRPHQRELDADALAMLLLSGKRKDGVTGLLSAAFASFCVLALSLLEDQQARSLDIPSSSHPTFRTRMTKLLEHNFLAFDDYQEPIGQTVKLDRDWQKHPSSYVLQNIYMAHVVGLVIDGAAPRSTGAAFGLRRW